MNPPFGLEPALVHTLGVLLYLGALLAVGAWKARGVKSQEDFSLAGRGLGTTVLVGTLLATWIGTGSIFGNAEKTLDAGVTAFLIPTAGALGILALWVLAPRVRQTSSFTLQDILEQRFGPGARVLGALTLLLAYIIIVSYQYRAGSAVMERIFPSLSPTVATCAVAAFVILYTALAGMVSVAYTDVANGVLMTLGLLLALPILLGDAGGPAAVLESLEPPQRELFGTYGVLKVLGMTVPAFMLLLGDANMYQRFFAARTPADARRSALGMFFGVLLLETVIIACALCAGALIAQGELEMPENPGHVLVAAAFDHLPTLLGTLLLATILAVVISTADSYLLSPATSMVRDVYQRFIAPDAEPARVVLLGRVLVVVLGLVALALAFTSDEFFYVAIFAYTLYGAGITPVLMAALFWKRATPAGAMSALVCGVATAIGWEFGGVNAALVAWCEESGASEGLRNFCANLDPVLPAVAANVGVLVVVSLLTKPRPQGPP